VVAGGAKASEAPEGAEAADAGTKGAKATAKPAGEAEGTKSEAAKDGTVVTKKEQQSEDERGENEVTVKVESAAKSSENGEDDEMEDGENGEDEM